MQGRLNVSSHKPRDEAEVIVGTLERGGGGGSEGERRGRGGGGGREGERRVAVLGPMSRNRAIHNDRVAIRLLPPSQRHTDGKAMSNLLS